MNKCTELPTCMPIYTTYNYQGMAGIIAAGSKTLNNWFYNNSILLNCHKKFLYGHTTPEIGVLYTDVMHIDEIEKIMYNVRFIKEDIHTVIKNMLNQEYYVCFNYFDDYYIKGKSLYNLTHRAHDGLVCGYDDNDKTYTIAAYNQDWIFSVFKTPQECLERAMYSIIERDNIYGYLLALKENNEVKLDIKYIAKQIKKYLSYNLKNCPPETNGEAFGIVVHDYMNMYIDRLLDGSIPYERTDKRIFRMLWEHKECMLERIHAVEEALNKDNTISNEYKAVSQECNKIRIMYSKYNMKKDRNLLFIIKDKIELSKNMEKKILRKFVKMINEEEVQ